MSRVYIKDAAIAVKNGKNINTRTLSFNDNVLYSYNTPIGFFSKKKNTFVLFTLKGQNRHFSNTTSRQVNDTSNELERLNVRVDKIQLERGSAFNYKDDLKIIIRNYEK